MEHLLLEPPKNRLLPPGRRHKIVDSRYQNLKHSGRDARNSDEGDHYGEGKLPPRDARRALSPEQEQGAYEDVDQKAFEKPEEFYREAEAETEDFIRHYNEQRGIHYDYEPWELNDRNDPLREDIRPAWTYGDPAQVVARLNSRHTRLH